MNPSDRTALFDVHDALVSACIAGTLPVDEFLASYGTFPAPYAFHGAGTPDDRLAFHCRVAQILAVVFSPPDPAKPGYGEAAPFLPAVVLMRLRELARRYPEFKSPAPAESVLRPRMA